MRVSFGLTLPMLRLLSYKAQGCKDFWRPIKPCHTGIHRIALTEYSPMNTHVPGFQSFFSFFASFFNGKISQQQHRNNPYNAFSIADDSRRSAKCWHCDWFSRSVAILHGRHWSTHERGRLYPIMPWDLSLKCSQVWLHEQPHNRT